jgi:hypothetical protein
VTAVKILERIVRPAPLGLRFRDTATGHLVGDGLQVTVTSLRNPGRRAELRVNGSGVWYAHRFPGFSAEALAETSDWAALSQPCMVEVEDRSGRFLPLRVALDLPVRGLAQWPGWADLPQEPLAPWTDRSSPPEIMPNALPLLSGVARMAPAPLAEIRCQLERDDGGPTAWALLTAAQGGVVRAIGQADAQGRAALFFPYPERPRASLASSPPAITEFRWSIELAAYWSGLDPAVPPELGDLLGQLEHPRILFASTLSPPEPLPPQLLSFARPLVLRTETAGSSSTLVMTAS